MKKPSLKVDSKQSEYLKLTSILTNGELQYNISSDNNGNKEIEEINKNKEIISNKKLTKNEKIEEEKELDYAHLASFIRNSPNSQANLLWQKVAEEINLKLNTPDFFQKMWISTSGLGVAWLHVRLDSVPKYYNWEPYQIT